MASGAVSVLAMLMPDLAQGIIAVKRIFYILDAENEHEEEKRVNPDALRTDFDGDIVLKEMSFKYPTSNKYILRDVSLTIKKGQRVAIVGPSGSGLKNNLI